MIQTAQGILGLISDCECLSLSGKNPGPPPDLLPATPLKSAKKADYSRLHPTESLNLRGVRNEAV